MNKTLQKRIHCHHFAHAEAYDRRAGKVFRGVYRRVAEDVAMAAPTGGAVLDAGCGSGRLAFEIAKRRPDLRVHGIDLERGMVEVATRHAEQAKVADRVEFTVADLADLPLPDDSVDLIVSTASLHLDRRQRRDRLPQPGAAASGPKLDLRLPLGLRRKHARRRGGPRPPPRPSARPHRMVPCSSLPAARDRTGDEVAVMSEPYVLNGRHRGRRATGQAQGSSLALMTLALDYHCHRTRHHWIRSTSKEDRIDEKVNLAEKLSPFAEHWRPKIVARINENDVRIVKVKGEFVWQKHEDTDDFFLVLEGDRNEKDRRS